MWFCFFPLLSKAIWEQSGKQNALMDMDKKEGMMTVLLLKVPPESWSRKKAAKEQ